MDAKTLFEQLFEAYRAAWILHFRTKTENWQLHKATEEFISKLEDAFHHIAEKGEDLGQPMDPRKCEPLTLELFQLVNGAIDSLSEAAKGDATEGTKNLLQGTADSMECLAGTLSGFAAEASETEEAGEQAE